MLKRRFRARHLVAFGTIAVGLLLGLLVSELVKARGVHDRAHVEYVQEKARRQAQESAAAVEKLLADMQNTGNRLLEQLNSGEVTSATAAKTTSALLASQPHLWGVGVTYDRRLPTAPADPNHYATRPGGIIKPGKITYNYEDPAESRGHWWRQAMEVGNTWVPPYLGGTTKKMVAVYTGRFYGPEGPAGGGPAGAIIISMQLDTLNRSVGWSELGSSGYGFVFSRRGSYPSHPSANENGGFVAHPNKAYWRGDGVPTFAEVVAANGNSAAVAMLDGPDLDPKAVFDYHDEITNEPAWLFPARLPTADWMLGFVAIKRMLIAGDRAHFRFNVGIFVAALLMVACLIVGAALFAPSELVRVWAIVMVITMVPAVTIGGTWRMQKIATAESPLGDVVHKLRGNEVELLTGLERLSESIDDYYKYVSTVSLDLKPHSVLAGVFLDAIEQGGTSAEPWRLSGTIWQRYANGVPDGETPGFDFPDAVEEPQFEPFYDVLDGDTRTIAWSFIAVVQPERDLRSYPFDKLTLQLRMVHRDASKPIVLIPDVAEYNLIVPIARPGLSPKISPHEFEISGSDFGFSTTSVNSTMGIPNFARQTNFPELTYTVHMNRKFVEPFLSQMFPVFVIMLLLFVVHLMATRPAEFSLVMSPRKMPKGMSARLWDGEHPTAGAWDEESASEPAGGNYYVQATLTSVLALMFVTILAHNNLRGTLEANDIVYLENGYFVLYVALLMVAVNSLLFGTGHGGRFVHWRKNLLPEVLYWPLILTMVAGSTLLTFY